MSTFLMFIIHFQDTKEILKCRKLHGIYWAALGFIDTEKANFINYVEN